MTNPHTVIPNSLPVVDRHLHWKRWLGRVWSLLPKNANRRIILIYHSVGTGPWSVPVGVFSEQMAWLKEHVQVVALDELIVNSNKPGLHIALTFDDGYESVYSIAFPILKAKNFIATVYLNTGWIDDETPRASDFFRGHYPKERFLTWKQVIELKDRGWTIGSHGVDHLDLIHSSPSEIETQVRKSKQCIEEKISRRCIHFCYGRGYYNKSICNILKRNGYHYAVTVDQAPLSLRTQPLALPRMYISCKYTMNDFIAVLQGKWDYLGIIQNLKNVLNIQ